MIPILKIRIPTEVTGGRPLELLVRGEEVDVRDVRDGSVWTPAGLLDIDIEVVAS